MKFVELTGKCSAISPEETIAINPLQVKRLADMGEITVIMWGKDEYFLVKKDYNTVKMMLEQATEGATE